MRSARPAGLGPPARASTLPAVGCAVILTLVWLVLAPRTADLAAQVYRTQLFARDGFVLWDNNWFGGHQLPAYSLLFPLLAATFGPALVGTASVITSAALFGQLVRDQGVGRRRATAWFACAAAGDLFIGRLTFALGVTCALACLLAVARDRPRTAVALGLLTAAASPVSGLLLTVVLVAWVAPLDPRWRLGVIAASPAGVLLLAVAFPEGGVQPYELQPALAALAITLAVALTVPRHMRAVRRGLLLYAAAVVAAYVVPSPMGSNVTRLGILAAGPLLMLGAGAGHLRRRPLVLLTALAIGAWQLWAPVTEVLKAQDNPATSAAYFAPLLQRLAGAPVGRVEVVPTSTRWESVYVARRVALARGWETQLDRRYDGLFYRPTLGAGAYLRWLRRLGVTYVALSDAPKERWGRSEERLLRHPPPGLRPLWRGRHWRLFAVSGVPSLVAGARLVGLGPDVVRIAAHQAGRVFVRVRYTRFWEAGPGVCVTPAAHGFTQLTVPRAGVYAMRTSLGVGALLDVGGAGCAGAQTPPPSARSR